MKGCSGMAWKRNRACCILCLTETLSIILDKGNFEQFTFYKDHLVDFVENGKNGCKSRNQKALRLSTAFVAQWRQDGKLGEELVQGKCSCWEPPCPGFTDCNPP